MWIDLEPQTDFCRSEPAIYDWLSHRNQAGRMLEEMWDMSGLEISVCAVLEIEQPVIAEKTLAERFQEQSDKWDRETAHLSSPTQRFTHPSYLAILGMANENRDEVIDLLLKDMQRNRREWFWMLSYLTHENPVEGKDNGKLHRMIEAWVKWGHRQGRGRL